MVCFVTFDEEAEQYLVAAVWECVWFGAGAGNSALSDLSTQKVSGDS
jgi:hypothetical protein